VLEVERLPYLVQPKIEVMKVMQTMEQRAKAEVTPIPTIYEEELIRHTTKRTTTSPGLYDQVDVWVGMMNFLLDLVVPSFQVVGGVGSLGLVVVP
jgi:hypothetical protein